MINKKFTVYLYTIACLLMLLWLGYWLEARTWVQLAYEQKAPGWFQNLIQSFYPRFGVEKQRFPLAFFIKKADQVVGRFVFICLGMLLFVYLYNRKQLVYQKVKNYWNQTTPPGNFQWQLRIFSGVIFLFTWDWYFHLATLGKAKAFYTPILPYRLLHLPFPDSFWLPGFFIVLLLANLALLVGYRVVLSSSLVSGLFILLQGYMYCFHKLDHTYATLTYVVLLMPLLAWYYQKSKEQAIAWSWQLMQCMVALVYLQAGLEKLLIGGWKWASPHTFRIYLYLHPTTLGSWLAQSDFWCTLLPWGALLFQLSFISIIFYPRLKWLFLPLGILFHLGTFFLFGIGWYYSPWMFVYLFFIQWQSK